MRENAASILKQRRFGTLGGTIDFVIINTTVEKVSYLVHEQAAGITIKSV